MKAAVRRGGGSVLVRAGVAVGAILLAGCSSNPAPAPLADPPTHSTSPTPTPVSDPSPSHAGPPIMPAAAKGTSAKAAKAFVRYYIATINQAMATGNTTGLSLLSGGDCDSCAAVAQRIGRVYRAGGKLVGRGWRVKTMQVVPDQPRQRPLIDVGLKLSPQVVIKQTGAAPVHFKGGQLPLTFHLSWRSGGWVVEQWERAA